MGTVRSLYTNSNTITITLASLADGATAISSAIDNSVNRFLTADFQLMFRTTTSTSVLGSVDLVMIRSADGGVTYDDAPVNTEVLGSFAANVDSTTFTASTDSSLSGQLPDFFKIGIVNKSGAAFNGSGANFSLTYLGKQFELV